MPDRARARDQFSIQSTVYPGTALPIKVFTICAKFEEKAADEDLLKEIIKYSNSAPCLNSTAEVTYLNRADVRRALHIPSNVGNWSVCSRQVIQLQDFIKILIFW